MMQAGKLRHLITIQTRTDTADSFGQPLASWGNLATNVPAERLELSGRELIAAQAVNNETTTLFVIRHLAGFDAKARIVHDGKTYEITAVLDPEGRRRSLRVHCKSGVNNG